MMRVFGRLTSKCRTTFPKKVREALGLEPGDALVYEIAEGHVVLRRAPVLDVAYLRALQGTLCEWSSPEDAAAFDDL